MNSNNQTQRNNTPAFTDFDHMLEHFHRKYGFSKQEIKASLKNMKKHGLIKYSTKAKNKPVIRLLNPNQNEALFYSYFGFNSSNSSQR